MGETHSEVKREEWMEDAEFRREYEAPEEEFAIIRLLVGARARAVLSQTQLAQRMGSTQSAIARLEGGKVMPSLATLRCYGEATASRLSVRMDAA